MINVWNQCEKEINELYQIDESFGRKCARHIHPVAGLDVFWLDDYLKTPDGVSTLAWVEQKYGKRVAEIIHKLATTTIKL